MFSLARTRMREGLTLDGVHPFALNDLLRVGEAGLDVFASQMVVLLDDLVDGVAGRQQVHHQLDADPCALDHGLADENVRVGHNPTAPVHTDSVSIIGSLGCVADLSPTAETVPDA